MKAGKLTVRIRARKKHATFSGFIFEGFPFWEFGSAIRAAARSTQGVKLLHVHPDSWWPSGSIEQIRSINSSTESF